MSKIKLEMDSGNFNLIVEGELSESKALEMQMKGLRYELERGGLSKVYNDLAGIPGKRAGTKVLPAGFKRESLVFSEETAMAFSLAAEKALAPYGDFKASVGKYVPSEGADSKYVAERAKMSQRESEGKLEEWLANVIGYTGDTHTEDGEDYNPAALAAIRAKVQAMAKAL